MIGFLASLFVLSLLVIVHEFGHFFAAKKAKIRVEEFGLGYPPRIKGIKIGETVYSLNLIPFGGFVRIHGTDEESHRPKEREGAFWAKPKRVRAAVLSAGILMNFLFGVVAFSLIYSILGIPQKQGFVKVLGVAEGSPAEEAGIKESDTINKLIINNLEFKIIANKEFIEIVNKNLGKEIELELKRGDEVLSLVVIPRKEPPEGEGPLGVAITDTKMIQPVFWRRPFLSFWWGLKEAAGWAGIVVGGVGRMIYDLGFKGIVPKDVTGPIGIVQIAANVARSGALVLLQFTGVLSVNLSVLNLLPIPALDGSRLLFLGYEVFTGKKPKPKFEKWVHIIGMIALLMVMLAITIQDISRISKSAWPF